MNSFVQEGFSIIRTIETHTPNVSLDRVHFVRRPVGPIHAEPKNAHPIETDDNSLLDKRTPLCSRLVVSRLVVYGLVRTELFNS